MIVKKAEGRGGGAKGRGHSFKGLSAYLLAKDGEHRAAWVSIENVGTDNPHMAARVMAATAKSADALKARAGVAATGRKAEAGKVYHLVMSWPEDQSPDAGHQQEAARGLLASLGMDRAQALMVAHNDNGKAHIHLMVNLVDPETGKQFSLSGDQRRMQAWALDYERANGGIRCEQRQANAEARARGEAAKDTRSLSRVEWERLKRDRDAVFARQVAERTQLRAAHSQQWDEARAELARRKAAYTTAYRDAKAEDREANRPLWRAMLKRHDEERRSIAYGIERVTAEAQRAVLDAVKARRHVERADRRAQSFFFRKVLPAIGLKAETPEQARERYAEAVRRRLGNRQALERLEAEKRALPSRHEAERKALHEQLKDLTATKARFAIGADLLDLDSMKKRQAAEIEQQRDQHNAEREAIGMKPYEPKARVGETPRKARAPERRRPTPFSVAADPERVADAAKKQEQDRRTARKAEPREKAPPLPARGGGGRKAGPTPAWGATLTEEQRSQRARLIERNRSRGREDDFERER